MEEDRIVLDRKSFEALAVDSRVRLLKALKQRRKTLTELSAELKLSPSSVKEHLEVLEGTDLIRKMDEGHKWKYYELTRKGLGIVTPKELRVFVLLSISLMALLASSFMLSAQGGVQSALAPQAMAQGSDMAVEPLLGSGAHGAIEADIYAGEAPAPKALAIDDAQDDDGALAMRTMSQAEQNVPVEAPVSSRAPYLDPALLLLIAAVSAVTTLGSLAILARNRLSSKA